MIHFITLVSPDFWPGFAALLESLRTNSGIAAEEIRFTLVCDPETAPTEWLDNSPMDVELLPMAALPLITVLTPQQQGKRMEVALQKCALFALPEKLGKCTYIDSDMLCVGPIREIEQFLPMTFTAELPIFTDSLPTDPFGNDSFECNTGLFVFVPNEGVSRELADTYSRSHAERSLKGDQDVFNSWMRERRLPVNVIGAEWNFAKRYSYDLGDAWIKSNLHRIKFLHFVGAKPWTPNAEINTFRECHYRWMEEMWWDYFERSGFAKHMDNPPRRSTAFVRQRVLPWSKPAILKEHAVRGCRLAKRLLGR